MSRFSRAIFLVMLVLVSDLFVLREVFPGREFSPTEKTATTSPSIDYPLKNTSIDYNGASVDRPFKIGPLDAAVNYPQRNKPNPSGSLTIHSNTSTMFGNGATRTSTPLLVPMRVWEAWLQHHSADIMKNETLEQLRDRKYVWASYGCPRQAGIATSKFLNSLLVAILTNRTLLVEYGGFMGWVRAGENAREVCFSLVQPASWIPWVNEFPIRKIMNRVPAFTVTSVYQGKAAIARINAGLPVANSSHHHQVVKVDHNANLGRIRGAWSGVLNFGDRYLWEYLNQSLGMSISVNSTMNDLYKYGHYFLYGMLLWNSFPFSEELLYSVREQIMEDNRNYYTIGMHSRHPSTELDGDNVSGEEQCLDNLLQRNITRPCRLFLMADRPVTVKKVAAYAKTKYACETIFITAYDDAKLLNSSSEHGPLAGAPFYQDLAVVSQAQDAYMVRHRSSSSLLIHLIEYHRRMAGKTTELDSCKF